jgi:hypothetical protein
MNKVRSKQSAAGSGRKLAYFCLLLSANCLLACSVPNLEQGACAEARTPVREFYSFHFGNDMKFSPENLKLREQYLTRELANRSASASEGTDPFTTGTEDIPKAFRVAECTEIAPNRTEFRVLLFWRDDSRTEQREIKIEAVKQNGKWLVDKMTRSTADGG